MKKRYNHNYNDGDIVTDMESQEVFKFSDERDGFRAEKYPQKLRLASEDEKNKLISTSQDWIKL